MYMGKILSSLNFTVPQAVNPHIAQKTKANKTFVTVVPKNIEKKNHLNSRKILDRNTKISTQPQQDEVIISNVANLQPTIKNSTKDNNSNGKTIKKVLSNFFDNSKRAEIEQYKKEKTENLNELVKDFEKERSLDKDSYFAQKKEAKKLMIQDAINKLAES